MEGVRVQSLIGELRAVQSKSKNLKKREREIGNTRGAYKACSIWEMCVCA